MYLQRTMWRCVKCGSEIEDKYPHCWQCGAEHVSQPVKQRESTARAVPGFASYEEMAKVPAQDPWMFRRGPIMRLFWFLLALGLVKVLSSRFLGAYGNYIVLIVGVAALIIILWRHFRRDPTEGVGINLH